MPSQIIHFLAGHAALQNSRLSRSMIVDEAFNLGCQGPDIFSHSRRTKPFALAYSRLLHRHDYGLFCLNFVRILGAQRDALLESWFYGFVTHQIVDRIFHPYIINRSFVSGSTGIEGVSPAHFHAFMERILDAIFFQDIEKKHLHTFDSGERFKLQHRDICRIAEAVAVSLSETYPSESSQDREIRTRIENAFADAINFYWVTNPVFTAMDGIEGCSKILQFAELGIGGVALLYPEELDLSIDWLNVLGKPWQHPVSGETYFASVGDLYLEAVAHAASAVNLASSAVEENAATLSFEKSIGNGCLSVCGPDGKIGSVKFYSPFDLGKTLLDQAAKRRAWISEGCMLTPGTGTVMMHT